MPLVCLSGGFPDATSASEYCRPLLCCFFKNSLICSTTTLGKIKKKWFFVFLFIFFYCKLLFLKCAYATLSCCIWFLK